MVPRAPKYLLLAVTLLIAAIIGSLAYQSASSSSMSSSTPSAFDLRGVQLGAGAGNDGAVTEADGVLPDGVTVRDDGYSGIANLDPALFQAMRDAAADAAGDGIAIYITSGWRSAEYQNELLRDAVAKYGSESEAARWVATAATSPHVSGNAVDVGMSDATDWLSRHGSKYGLCQTYLNEPWHYELRPEAAHQGCPRMYVDPTDDPRMPQ